jgi:hypothetical protein
MVGLRSGHSRRIERPWLPGKHRSTSPHDSQKNPRPRPGVIVAVQKTLALATLAALALSALAALPTLLAALSGLLLLLTRLLLAAALLAALTAALVLLTTLILLARLLFVGVHICSFEFPPWRDNNRVETKFPQAFREAS